MARVIDIQPIIEEIQSTLEIPSYSEHNKGYDDGLEYVLDLIEKAPTLTPPNEPLTLEQLREMEDPVWCVRKTVEGFEGFWCLCNHGYILTPARQIFDVKEIPHWVFYRRPPEGEEE